METQHPWIERHAKLFEAGDYPDKGISISPEDLSRLQSNFKCEVPILIEHATSPLEIGFLTAVRAEGSELFGTVQLSPEANALIEKSNAKALSIGLSVDLDAIEEVSLVREPRVATARIFSGQFSQEDWHAKFMALEHLYRENSVKAKKKPSLKPGQGLSRKTGEVTRISLTAKFSLRQLSADLSIRYGRVTLKDREPFSLPVLSIT